ncbi:STAS domain-containing protein [Pseudonocardia ailaonensis]|uniref:STAS domain-containing protein n=1 Tax=Pseudonocardia ailaonensis TaxID=367279 RepID=UPI0031E3F45E
MVTVVGIGGELDLTSVPGVARRLSAVLERPVAEMIIDLSTLTFCAVHGMRMLTVAARQVARGGTRLVLSGASEQVVQLVTTLWPSEWVARLYEDASAAVLVHTAGRSTDRAVGIPSSRSSSAPVASCVTSARGDTARRRRETYRSALDHLRAADGPRDDNGDALISCLQTATDTGHVTGT